MATNSNDLQVQLLEHEKLIGSDDHRLQLLVRHENGKYLFDIGTSNSGVNIGSKCWVSWTTKTGGGRSKEESEWLGFRTWKFNFDGMNNGNQGGRDATVHRHIKDFMDVAQPSLAWEKIEYLRTMQGNKSKTDRDAKRRSCDMLNKYIEHVFDHVYSGGIVVCLAEETRFLPDGRRGVSLQLSHPAFASYWVAKPDTTSQVAELAATASLESSVNTPTGSASILTSSPAPSQSAGVRPTNDLISPPVNVSTMGGEGTSTAGDPPLPSNSLHGQGLETAKRGHQEDDEEAAGRRIKRLREEVELMKELMQMRQQVR